jgi:ADP-heptose:LPS heptosyltransferase
MSFRLLRLLDQILGTCLLLILRPICGIITRWLPAVTKETPQTIAILKLHGGGSLLIAWPMLLGIRNRYKQAIITLIGTPETQKYAEMAGIFDRYILIDSTSLPTLAISGIKALTAARRQDVLIDLEPHSTLAAVFTPLTFAARRIGFVKAHETHRVSSYTDAIYFNLHAPIHLFYEQIAKLLYTEPAVHRDCQVALRSKLSRIEPTAGSNRPKPVIYISAFASSLSKERMLPTDLWIAQIKKKFSTLPVTIILGGGPGDIEQARDLAARIQLAIPSVSLINACGTRNLLQAAADIDNTDEFWGIDSGPLHIARLLGKRCTSFWGPTNPAYLLTPIPGLDERIHYKAFACSPCVHVAASSPCKGNNQCMKQLFADPAIAPMIKL